MMDNRRFSERAGLTRVKEAIQVDDMDDDLRNGLWSVFVEQFIARDNKNPNGSVTLYSHVKDMYRALWLDFFKLPLDSLPQMTAEAVKFIRQRYFGATWYGVYDFVEFVARRSPSDFVSSCNDILQREVAGYRIVARTVTPITDENELAAIHAALTDNRGAKLAGVREHLATALGMLSDRKSPDYRNSVKESISAVESLAKVVAGDPTTELAGALKMVEAKVPLHPAMKKGFLALYGYTSDEGGIRHALVDADTVDFADAKYMLATCSAFVNFLTVRAGAAGIPLT